MLTVTERCRAFVLPLLATALLSACASYSGRDLVPGVATQADVVAQMGAPAMQWEDADGGRQLAYPRGPEGPHTFMVFIAPDGHVRRIENVLSERHFAGISAGMTEAEVLRIIGPSQPQWTAFFAARDELVREWRYCDGGNVMAKFDVLFDGTSLRVRTTFSRPDYRGPDSIAPTCGQVPGR